MDNGYDRKEFVLYCEFTDIKEWYHLKAKIPEIPGGVSYGDSNIKFLQALAWWVTYLTLQGIIIDLNDFKTDMISYAIEESRIDFEDTRDGKGDLIKLKEFSHENWS